MKVKKNRQGCLFSHLNFVKKQNNHTTIETEETLSFIQTNLFIYKIRKLHPRGKTTCPKLQKIKGLLGTKYNFNHFSIALFCRSVSPNSSVSYSRYYFGKDSKILRFEVTGLV